MKLCKPKDFTVRFSKTYSTFVKVKKSVLGIRTVQSL